MPSFDMVPFYDLKRVRLKYRVISVSDHSHYVESYSKFWWVHKWKPEYEHYNHDYGLVDGAHMMQWVSRGTVRECFDWIDSFRETLIEKRAKELYLKKSFPRYSEYS